MNLNRAFLSIALSIVMLAGAAAPAAMAEEGAAGQAPHSMHQKHKRGEHFQKFTQELNLTDDQKAKMKALRESFKEAHKSDFEAMKAKRQQLMELKKSGASEDTIKTKREEMKTQFTGLREDKKRLMAQMQALLTPEQRAKVETHKQQMSEKRAKCRSGKHQN